MSSHGVLEADSLAWLGNMQWKINIQDPTTFCGQYEVRYVEVIMVYAFDENFHKNRCTTSLKQSPKMCCTVPDDVTPNFDRLPHFYLQKAKNCTIILDLARKMN